LCIIGKKERWREAKGRTSNEGWKKAKGERQRGTVKSQTGRDKEMAGVWFEMASPSSCRLICIIPLNKRCFIFSLRVTQG
jgi:hypothetical protein